MKRLVLIVFGVLFGTLLFAGPASAHATLIISDPSDGARLKTAPKTVTLNFDENVGIGSVGYVHVTDQSGKSVDARAAYHPGGDGSRVADDLRDSLGDGTYTVSWRVISADSHPVAGVVRFVVGNGPLVVSNVGSGPTVNHATSVLFDISRWIGFGGLALLGGVWLALTVWPQGRDDLRAKRLVLGGWLASTAGALLELLLQGPYTAGTGPSRTFSSALIDSTLHSNYGQLLSLRLVLLGVLAVILARAMQPAVQNGQGQSRIETAVWPIAVVMASTFSGAGHADTTNPRWLSIVLDATHVLSMTAWLGGLLMLLLAVLPRHEPEELQAVLPVFSRVAFVAIGALAITGTYAAWRGIGAWAAIFGTTYGLLVMAKVLLFVGLLAVGNMSRRLVQRRATREGATIRLRRAVFVEAVIGLSVLAFTSVLVAEPRGAEALAADYRKPHSATASLGGGKSVTVTVEPGVHGLITATVELSSPAQSIEATATQNAKRIGPIPLKLVANGKLLYSAGGVNLPVAGAWEFDLVVTESEFNAITADVVINLH